MPAVQKAFLFITSDRVRQRSRRGTPLRDSNQGNQTWSIQVVFASDKRLISVVMLCFKFPAFVWICGGENIFSFWVPSLELNPMMFERSWPTENARTARLFDGNIVLCGLKTSCVVSHTQTSREGNCLTNPLTAIDFMSNSPGNICSRNFVTHTTK